MKKFLIKAFWSKMFWPKTLVENVLLLQNNFLGNSLDEKKIEILFCRKYFWSKIFLILQNHFLGKF
jgi:hypothetical protein